MYLMTRQVKAANVSIVATTNDQVDLIRDIVRKKCAWHASFGKPASISTVEEHQGRCNKIVILSLVRTTTVIETIDRRRMAAALSTATNRLYILCKLELYRHCPTISCVVQAIACK